MIRWKTLAFALPLGLSLSALLIVPSNSQEPPKTSKGSTAQTRKKVIDVNHFPLVEFSTPETTNAKRKARGEKHNRSEWAVHPDAVGDNTVKVDSVDISLPALPTSEAAAIVVGTVTDAKAYLSNDKRGVYSAFTVLISEVLKSPGNLTVGGSIEVEREGGRVRFPSGRVHLYMVAEQSMPLQGHIYVFFLASTSDESGFEVLTGYEIRENIIYPLDELSQARSYEGITAENLFNEVKTRLKPR